MCVPVRQAIMCTMILSSDRILQVIVYKLLNHIKSYEFIILNPMNHTFCFDLDWQGLMPNSAHRNTLTERLLGSVKDYD